MPSRQIICLANSWKLGERCIAGIDINTGKWVRPVCDEQYPEDGRVPKAVRLIGGREPELLDILEIPLAETGNDFGFECENLSVLPGQWKCLGKVKPTTLLQYCENCENLPFILHNTSKAVLVSYLQALTFPHRLTLKLVHTVNFFVEKKDKWRGTIQLANNRCLSEVSITDPVFIEKLEEGHQPRNNCLVTVSLGMPLKSDSSQGKAECWKLIAGVIEL